jgi:hypothetical protein
MIEDSTEEFHTMPIGEGGSNLPSPRRRGIGAPPTPVTTGLWMENTPATQAMMAVPPWVAAPRSDIGLPIKR